MTAGVAVAVLVLLFGAFALLGVLLVRSARRTPPRPRAPRPLTRRGWIGLWLIYALYAVFAGVVFVIEGLDWFAIGYVAGPAISLGYGLWTAVRLHRASRRRLA